MAAAVRERDFEEERRQRDRFLLLQHALTLSEADPTLPAERLWRDLGFSRSEGLPLIESLFFAGYLAERGAGPRVSLTPRAIEYLERRAGRRRSVRLLP